MPRNRPARIVLTVAAVASATLAFGAVPALAHDQPMDDHGSVTVHVGQSIQAALDAATAGSTVLVEPGAYRENIVIAKAVHLLARGVVLLSPTAWTPGPCTNEFGAAGVCVAAPIVDPNAPLARLAGVTIVGIRVTEAAYDGIAVLGSEGLVIEETLLDHNGGAGLVVFDSVHATVINNEIGNNAGPGVVLAFSQAAGARISENTIYNNAAGILLSDSSGADITENHIHGNCIGVAIADHGGGGAGATHVTLNVIAHNNMICGDADVSGGIGVLLSGAHDTTVNENVIDGHNAGSSTFDGSGVTIKDSTSLGGTVPLNNSVVDNRLTDNLTDVKWDGTGAGIDLSGNHCRTSVPGGVCTPLINDGDDPT